MHENELADLLCAGDRASAPPAVEASDLVQRVRNRNRRQTIARRVVVTTTICTALALVGLWQLESPNHIGIRDRPTAEQLVNDDEPPQTSTFNADEIETELARVESELRVAMEMTTILERDRQLNEARQVVSRFDSVDEVRLRVDVVADGMLWRADKLLAGMQLSEEAIAIYQNLIELFPQTPSAELARGRLAAFPN